MAIHPVSGNRSTFNRRLNLLLSERDWNDIVKEQKLLEHRSLSETVRHRMGCQDVY